MLSKIVCSAWTGIDLVVTEQKEVSEVLSQFGLRSGQSQQPRSAL